MLQNSRTTFANPLSIMPTITNFTPWSSLAGGALIGLAASLLLFGARRIAGISGIAGRLLIGAGRGDRAWRLAFLVGLVMAGLIAARFVPGSVSASPRPLALVALAGVLVGFGTRLGNGCTSGHGVCGVSRGSPRSIAATLTFVGTGVLTATIVRWLGGAS